MVSWKMSILNNAPPEKAQTPFDYSVCFFFLLLFLLFIIHSVLWFLYSFLSFRFSFSRHSRCQRLICNEETHSHTKCAKEEFCMFIHCPWSMILPAYYVASLFTRTLQKLFKIEGLPFVCVYLIRFFFAYFVIFFSLLSLAIILTTRNRNWIK